MVGREKRVSLGAYCAEGLRAGREKNCGYCSTGSELRHGIVFKFGVKCSSWELSVTLWLLNAVNWKHVATLQPEINGTAFAGPAVF